MIKAEREICIGLAEVCEGLCYLKETTPAQANQFKRYANTFRKFSKLKDKKQKEVIQMAKRLTDHEKEEREVKRVLQKIRKLEKAHPQRLVERACYRYKNANLERRSAEKEMKILEKRLAEAKKKLR